MYNTVPRSTIGQLIEIVTLGGAKKATKYISPRLIAKATRRHRPDRRCNHNEILVTIGTPNFAEQAFINACQTAGEPFPVKKIQIKWYPKK